MIVKKPIGAVKVEGKVCPLTVGKSVPENVLKFWKKTEQIEGLKKAGIIGEPDKPDNKSKVKQIEIMKESYKKMNPNDEKSKNFLKEIEALEKQIKDG